MKTLTIGAFASREDAEKAINRLHNDLNISTDDISYIYRNTEGEVTEHDADDIARDTVGESAGKGAAVGATIGAIAGLATFAGVIPVIGPLFVAGPLATALGLTGAAGAAAAGGVAGAAGGALIAGLVRLGVSDEHAKRYADRVEAGNILVTVSSDSPEDATAALVEGGATDVESYQPSV